MSGITVIGGANIDIQGYPFAGLVPADSNPGRVTVSYGGVGRNIAENLARLGLTTRLITVFGTDAFSTGMRENLAALGIDTSSSMVLDGQRSSVYLCTLARDRSLYVAIADMQAIDQMGPEWIDLHQDAIAGSQLCVVDANLSQQTLERIARIGGGVRLLLDPVSETKAVRAAGVVGSFYAVKPNVREAEVLSGIRIVEDDDLSRAADELHRRGTSLVFISLGRRGLYFSGQNGRGFAAAHTEGVEVRNVSGAGDAAGAALAWGIARGLTPAQLGRTAVAAASLTTAVEQTVDPFISADTLSQLAGRVRITEA